LNEDPHILIYYGMTKTGNYCITVFICCVISVKFCIKKKKNWEGKCTPILPQC